ncbi:MAG: hypothetical protein E7463_06680 [Ruminococcaceae bacterium]|nr:hypothetical protein [Oscillospiraceae bacterium]
MNTINISRRLEPLWDSFLPDSALTTAKLRVNHPTFCDTPLWLDKIFDENSNELFGISYPILVRAGDIWRLYYHPCRSEKEWKARGGDYAQAMLCVLESRDGVNWERPALTNFPDADGNPTNIVFSELNDGVFVFCDENPACPAEEKFKALVCRVIRDDAGKLLRRWLHCYTSSDGYTFDEGYPIHEGAEYDSINLALWRDGQYTLYYRKYDYSSGEGRRTIRCARSHDFRNWDELGELRYNDNKTYQLYTNQIMPYPRASHLFIGFPTRYVERKAWTPNMESMPAYPIKKAASDENPPVTTREGLAVTDCLFMVSRDGENWHRFCEAFMTPGPETSYNWVYGNCYPSYQLLDNGDEYYYLYTIDNHLSYNCAKPLNRWKIRKDGFAFYEADDNGAVIVTKPVVFDGAKLHLNFETSAAGSIYVDLLDADGNPIEGKTSFELFGNAVDRTVFFADGSDFAAYAGKPVRLRFRMQDAKLYSLYFA